MGQLRVAVIPAPGAPIEVREISEPALETGAALLRVELSEVCGTDVSLHAGRLEGVPYPLVPGHVSVGRLERIRGPLLDVDGRALREGDRVTFLDVHRTCHSCWTCLVAKATTRCPRRKVYGITYGLEDGPCGGWAEAIHLKPGTLCIPLHGTEPERFMAGGCSLPTALHAVERAGILPGDTILVLGSGRDARPGAARRERPPRLGPGTHGGARRGRDDRGGGSARGGRAGDALNAGRRPGGDRGPVHGPRRRVVQPARGSEPEAARCPGLLGVGLLALLPGRADRRRPRALRAVGAHPAAALRPRRGRPRPGRRGESPHHQGAHRSAGVRLRNLGRPGSHEGRRLARGVEAGAGGQLEARHAVAVRVGERDAAERA